MFQTKKQKVEVDFELEIKVTLACRAGDIKTLKKIKEKGVLVNITNPIETACENGDYTLVQFLFDWLDVSSYNGRLSFLTIATIHKNLELVKYLLAFDHSKIGTNHALYFACQKGFLEIVKILVENGEDLEAGPHSESPLVAAVTCNFLEIAKLLIENEADVNVFDCCGDTLLHIATKSKNEKMIALLLESEKTNPYRRNSMGHDVFGQIKNFETAKVFFDHGVDLKRGDGGMGLLVKGICADDIKLVNLALQIGANPRASIHLSSPILKPLSLASLRSNLEILETLISFGFDEYDSYFMWLNLEINNFKVCKLYLKKNIPFSPGFKTILTPKISWIKSVFLKHGESSILLLLLSARRKNPESPFFEDNLPLDMFNLIFKFTKKGLRFEREVKWNLLK